MGMGTESLSRQVGQKIRGYRKRLGMTVSQLAQGVGITQQQMVRIEAGLSGVNLARLNRIAEVLGVSMVDLIPSPGMPPPDWLQLALRSSGLTPDETERVLEYARLLRLDRRLKRSQALKDDVDAVDLEDDP